MSVEIPPYMDGVPMNAPSSKVTKADTIHSGETRRAVRQESTATNKTKSGSWWKPAAKVAAVGAGAYYLYNQLPSLPSLPSYTKTVGGAFQDVAFVPDAPLSQVQNAQRAVYQEQFPGYVKVAANPQVSGVDWGQTRGEFMGFDSTYRAPASLYEKPAGATWFDLGGDYY